MPEVQEKETEGETELEKEMLRRFDDYEQGKIVPYRLMSLKEECAAIIKTRTFFKIKNTE